ncbi:MAG: amylo-alpha-1,6-glucosidase [Myxacorys chilensis ATA2-1-KO14]|jgi:predicted glycogen debranching enzyme|nr:amylo-alpha-1,6-glucosidase [Myxacorys chilensis ATA2-1-KO14]
MVIDFGREICGALETAETREWLVTNGIGGFASGTIAGLLNRRYHGLLIAALKPPLQRTLLLAKLEDSVRYGEDSYPLTTNRWSDGTVRPEGYQHIERFYLTGTIPVWRYACGDALLEKRIWMQQGENTTYVQYHLHRSTQPLTLTLKTMINYRDYHGDTSANDWQMDVESVPHGVRVSAFPQAVPFYLLCGGNISLFHDWYYGFDLAAERSRGLRDREDHLHVATFQATLEPGQSLTLVASTEATPNLEGESALRSQQVYEQRLHDRWKIDLQGRLQSPRLKQIESSPPWIRHLISAADQFIVNRPQPNNPNGKTIIAGYPWFSDWGRDTMISLPGLTLATGRTEIARSIIQTFAQSVDQGMLPNRFPDAGELPDYNTADATLWYFVAIYHYYIATDDQDLIEALFPVLADIIDWHCRGTRFGIHLDAADGLLYAGKPGTQLTWMDAKVGDWVVTPRIGKPIEVNALWYNALRILAKFARQIGKPHREYDAMAERTLVRFSRFWNESVGYCYDLLDSPDGDDAALRPNQIFAVSLPESPLSAPQQKAVVDACSRSLLTSYGLRSLDPKHPNYKGQYGGDPVQRDGAYHQGTVWGWLIGPYAIAHYRVYDDAIKAREFLEPMANHLSSHGLGSLSEIFDGDAPMIPNGCFAQAWTVAEVLRAWFEIGN